MSITLRFGSITQVCIKCLIYLSLVIQYILYIYIYHTMNIYTIRELCHPVSRKHHQEALWWLLLIRHTIQASLSGINETMRPSKMTGRTSTSNLQHFDFQQTETLYIHFDILTPILVFDGIRIIPTPIIFQYKFCVNLETMMYTKNEKGFNMNIPEVNDWW